eukprot:sb/3472946/
MKNRMILLVLVQFRSSFHLSTGNLILKKMVVVPSGYEVGELAKKHFFASLYVRHNLVSARFVREATPLTDRDFDVTHSVGHSFLRSSTTLAESIGLTRFSRSARERWSEHWPDRVYFRCIGERLQHLARKTECLNQLGGRYKDMVYNDSDGTVVRALA